MLLLSYSQRVNEKGLEASRPCRSEVLVLKSSGSLRRQKKDQFSAFVLLRTTRGGSSSCHHRVLFSTVYLPSFIYLFCEYFWSRDVLKEKARFFEVLLPDARHVRKANFRPRRVSRGGRWDSSATAVVRNFCHYSINLGSNTAPASTAIGRVYSLKQYNTYLGIFDFFYFLFLSFFLTR